MRASHPLRTLRARWRKIKTVHRTAISTVLAGALVIFAIYTAFYHFRDIGFFEGVVDNAMDQRMFFHADTGDMVPPPTLLDFGDGTLKALGDPIVVPPRHLAGAVERVAAMRPKALFVDLDVSYLGSTGEAASLAAVLVRVADSGVPVLLEREVLPGDAKDGRGRLRSTLLDRVVNAHPNLAWVSTNFPPSQDGLIRHIRPWEVVQLGDRPVALPSAALMLHLADRTGGLGGAKRSFAAAIRESGAVAPNRLAFRTASGQLALDSRANTRIDYQLKWEDAPHLTSIPALPLLDPRRTLDPELFAGRIVILGSTAGFRDYAPTPLERMPGPWIHANAIHAWLTLGPDPGLRFWRGALFIVPVTMAVAFAMTALLWRVPSRFRSRVRGIMPFVVTALFWLLFQLLGTPSISVGLLVVTFVVIRLIIFAEKRFDWHIRRSHS